LFASLAPVLAHSGLIEKAPDWSSIATHIRHFAMLADRTAFAGIRRVRAGQVSRWRGGRWDEAPIWAPSTRVDRANKDWLYDYRSTVEQAIADVLPTSGLIASQLSAGRDSSAVTAIASRLAPDRVVAITLVPRPGSVPLVRNGAIYDEGPQARKTARMLGISHELVDGGSSDQQMHWLKAVQADRHLPLWSVTAPGLWMAMACKAAELGAETMLSGGLGNLGLTSGGSPFLSALLKEEGAGDWWRVARGVARVQGWRTTLNHSSPVPLRMLRRGLLERRAAARDAPNFWRGPLSDGGHIAFPRTGGLRSAREEVAAVLTELDHANPHLEALTKVRLVDPTGDRRLLELMLRVPARHLVSADGGRPLYEAAFRDVLPGELLSERRRARQAGDWYRAFDPILCRALLEEAAQHTAVREVIDVAAVQKRLERWPQDFAAASVVDDEFRLLLSSLSLALFLQQHF
jgi:asparagine synthase (glutamine-hydrolysing)